MAKKFFIGLILMSRPIKGLVIQTGSGGFVPMKHGVPPPHSPVPAGCQVVAKAPYATQLDTLSGAE